MINNIHKILITSIVILFGIKLATCQINNNELIGNNKDAIIENQSKVRIYDCRKDTLKYDLLDTLLLRYKNRVIYIDNWSSWCSPCLKEMDYSVELQKEFVNKEIVFVFLCIPASSYYDNLATSIVNEKQIPGEHYFMNYWQAVLNQERFKSKGIPRYMLINKKGIIIDNDAPWPSSAQIRGKLNELINE